MRPLGVGLVYNSELHPLFRESNPDLGVLELEPETLWDRTFPASKGGSPVYVPNASALRRIAELPQHKLIHSVGFPVGGSARLGDEHVWPLAHVTKQMRAAWVSEHLSFNAIETEHGVEQTGFLLPPRQTSAGVDVAVANIRQLSSSMPAPFAFETGVNYLQPRADELPDGEFFASIAEQADCGILLDLHNLWVNERNGRQRVFDALEAMPLERVWEVHLAGGMNLGDYYLDSHSDLVATELLEIAAEVVPRLPNLGALLFEILPGFVARVGIDAVRNQLPLLQDLWKRRSVLQLQIPRCKMKAAIERSLTDDSDVREWERRLGALAIGSRYVERGAKFDTLAADPGVNVLQTLITEARNGRVSRAVHFTMTLLLLHLGPGVVRALLRDYQASHFPDVFTGGEANSFACFLWSRVDTLREVPYLREVLMFEHAMIRATLYGAASRIDWQYDPGVLFESLERGHIPEQVVPVGFSMDIRAA